MVQPIIVVLQRCAHHMYVTRNVVLESSHLLCTFHPIVSFPSVHWPASTTCRRPWWCATALYRPEQCVPLSDAGRGCPRTPARSSPQVAHAPQNECDCAAVARLLFGRP